MAFRSLCAQRSCASCWQENHSLAPRACILWRPSVRSVAHLRPTPITCRAFWTRPDHPLLSLGPDVFVEGRQSVADVLQEPCTLWPTSSDTHDTFQCRNGQRHRSRQFGGQYPPDEFSRLGSCGFRFNLLRGRINCFVSFCLDQRSHHCTEVSITDLIASLILRHHSSVAGDL